MSTPTNGKEVVLEAEDVVAGYVSEVDILNGVSMTVSYTHLTLPTTPYV